MFLSPIKIMVIVAVVLLLMGPDKLPEVAHRLGSSWRALKRLQERVESEVRDAIPDLPSTGDIARIVRSPINLLESAVRSGRRQRGRRGEEERAARAGRAATAHHPAESAGRGTNREFDAAA
jgi:TatA/E family protein of Tat protein translocase